jgi:hypothetical protein
MEDTHGSIPRSMQPACHPTPCERRTTERRHRLSGLPLLPGLVLVVVLAGYARAEPPPPTAPPDAPAGSSQHSACTRGYKVPGRPLDSKMPWEFFLGNASHRMIAYIYSTRHPTRTVFYNTATIEKILQETGIADSSLLLKGERLLRPDITDITALDVFEVKPPGEQALAEGASELQTYLAALNKAMPADLKFSGGVGFEGEILIQFGAGNRIWRLEWCTTAPGVVQYHWTRGKNDAASLQDAYKAGEWVELTEQEIKQFGGWVAQVTEELVERREKVATFREAVGRVIDVVGGATLLVITTAASAVRGTGAATGQSPPATPGGKVLPFRRPPTPSPAHLPKASGM